jgi:hypothetical protein
MRNQRIDISVLFLSLCTASEAHIYKIMTAIMYSLFPVQIVFVSIIGLTPYMAFDGGLSCFTSPNLLLVKKMGRSFCSKIRFQIKKTN